jgi:hypothetical protein
MKFKAPKRFVPPPDQPLARVAADLMAFQEQYIACLQAANGLDLQRAKVRSPGTSLIKLSLGQGFALMTAHERRHLWQARQVKNNARFPQA